MVAIQEVGGVNLDGKALLKKAIGEQQQQDKTEVVSPQDEEDNDAKIMSDPTIHGFFDFRSRKFLQKFTQSNHKSEISDKVSS